MHQALYRTERPQVFDSVIGQDNIVKVLQHQINEASTNHAYLLCGTRGTGKTTIARLIAKGLNCLEDKHKPCGVCDACKKIEDGRMLDVVEFDAASHRSINDIRDIQESVNYPPAEGKKKVYIIDEAHMLTKEASNGILKILEEPPEYVIFILATTEPQSILQTIKSRCIQFDFKRVSRQEIEARMNEIATKKNVKITSEGLLILSSKADGSVRDGLSLLDQCISSGKNFLDRDDILDFLGLASDNFFFQLTNAVLNANVSEAIIKLENILADGKDVKQIMQSWLEHYRGLLIAKYVDCPETLIGMSKENIALLKKQSDSMSIEELNKGILEISKTINMAKKSSQARILLEMLIVNLATVRFDEEDENRIKKRRIANFENEVNEKTDFKNKNKNKIDPSIELSNSPSKEKEDDKDLEINENVGNLEFSDEEEFFDLPKDINLYDDYEETNLENGQSDFFNEVEKSKELEAENYIKSKEVLDLESLNENNNYANYDRAKTKPVNSGDVNSVNSEENLITDKEYLKDLWDELFDALEDSNNASFKLVHLGGVLSEINKTQFKIIVNSRFYKERLEKRRLEVTEYISKRLGRNLSMVIKLKNDLQEDIEDDFDMKANDVKKSIESKLGIDITIK